MTTRISFAAFTIFATLSAAAPRDVVYSGVLKCCLAPTFDKGYVFQMDSAGNAPSSGLTVFGPKGQLLYHVSPNAPDGSPAYLNQEGAVVDQEGFAVLSMWWGGYGGLSPVKGGGIIILDQTGRQVKFIDTGRFMPKAVCTGNDDSIWITGAQFGPRDGPSRGADYPLVRHYSRDGNQLGMYLMRSTFSAGLDPTSSGISWMRAASDRIGIMTYPGKASDTPTWVELDFSGKEIGRWAFSPEKILFDTTGWAFSSDGRLFARPRAVTAGAGTKILHVLSVFDRGTGSWKHVDAGPDSPLMGADGTDLVFWVAGATNGLQLSWITSTNLH